MAAACGHHHLVGVGSTVESTCSRRVMLYKCGWSPMVGEQLQYKVTQTFVNGNLVYDEGKINDEKKGQRVSFDR